MAEAKTESSGENSRLARGSRRGDCLVAPGPPLTIAVALAPESKEELDTFITEVDGQGEVSLVNGRKRDLEDIANDLMMLLDTSKVRPA